jgi:hypothetical protein
MAPTTMQASTTSLEKTGDVGHHTEDVNSNGRHERPEALKDMSDSELLILEKKIVRKMDCIIL